MKKTNLTLFILTIIFSLVVLTSCKKVAISINESSDIYVGDEIELKASVENYKDTLSWSSSDDKIATITNDGLLKALSEGEVIITVKTTNKKVTEASITLKILPEKAITLTLVKDTLIVNEEMTIGCLSNFGETSFTWTSSNKEIASIDETGKVKALKAGTTEIKAVSLKDPKVFKVISITIKDAPYINILNNNTTIELLEGLQIAFETKGEVGEITWTSSDESIATINNELYITSLALGEITITGTSKLDANVKDSFILTIVAVPEIKLTPLTKILLVDDEYNLDYELIGEVGEVKWESSDTEIATVDETGKVKALKEGTVDIKLSSLSNENLYKTVTITIENKPEIIITSQSPLLYPEETFQINYNIKGTIGDIIWSSSNDEIATVDQTGKVTTVKNGSTTIKATSKLNSEVYDMIEITIDIKPKITITTENTTIDIGDELQIAYTTEGQVGNLVWSSSNTELVTISDTGLVKGVSEGKVTITLASSTVTGLNKTVEITVNPLDKEAPLLKLKIDAVKDCEVMYNEAFNPLTDVEAIDDRDGDLTSKIEVTGTVDTKIIGTYNLTYVVKDKAGNVSNEIERSIKVVWNSSVTFIGHAGCYSGIMNTEEAFLNAVTKHSYQAIECDVKQTKDGVFVTCHDDSFGGKAIASTNYDDIKDVESTITRGGVTYTSKICTFERYLEICKEYHAKAIVELKSSAGITNSDQSRMAALLKLIEDKGMLREVIFLGSQYKCLEWVRNNGYDYIPCQYLVNSCESSTVYEECTTWDFDLSFNIDTTYSNSDEWLARYKDAGLKISAWTFNQYSTVNTLQQWINKGLLDYVTVDKILPYEVTLPPKSPISDETRYEVKFIDFDGTVLKTSYPLEGKAAVSPLNPIREGYNFTGWDVDYKNVVSDLVVTAQYELVNYTVRFEACLETVTAVAWDSKEAFKTEFYNDFYEWLKTRVGFIAGLSVENDTYTLEMNGKTSSWKDGVSLMAVDKYTVELCQGHFIYKPTNRTEYNAVVPEADENYFLNSALYRVKYQALDGYFINCIKNNYSSYNRNYNESSAKKVQIFFRLQQWAQGTTIAPFDIIPTKYVVEKPNLTNLVMPEATTYTYDKSLTLPVASCEGYTFIGWYDNAEYNNDPILYIPKNSCGNITFYAKWEKNE